MISPKLIVAMGRFAVQALLRSSEPIGRLRGRVHAWRGVPLVVTYHPAYLLRTPSDSGSTTPGEGSRTGPVRRADGPAGGSSGRTGGSVEGPDTRMEGAAGIGGE